MSGYNEMHLVRYILLAVVGLILAQDPCDNIAVPANGVLFPSTASIDHGIKLTVSCNDGYQLYGPSFAVCDDGEWDTVGDEDDIYESYCGPPCGGVFNAESGTITSPNYPDAYPSLSRCVYVIDFIGSVYIYFNSFDTEEDYDYLHYGVGKPMSNRLEYLHYDYLPFMLELTGPVWFMLTSDEGSGTNGFSLTYQFVCSFKLSWSIYVTDESSKTVTYTIERLGPRAIGQSVTLSTEDITAMDGTDYKGFTDLIIEFMDDVSETKTESIVIYTDFVDERPEEFKICITSSSDGTSVIEPTKATVVIHDSEPSVQTSGMFTFEKSHYDTTEGDDVTIQICRAGDLTDSATVELQTTGIDAQPPGDFTGINNLPVNFEPDSDKSDPIIIKTMEDLDVEPEESFELSLVSSNVKISTSVVWIKDNDEPCPEECDNGGFCLVSENTCWCPVGYTGDQCQTSLCPQSCENGGFCFNSTTCHCPRGYTGDQCETSICPPSCENGGLCMESTGTCWCQPGFTGDQCQTSLCPPCENGGFCIADTCQCLPGYTGSQCEISLCPLCENGGFCIGTTCQCLPGYTGYQCETTLCVPQCQHGGYCTGTGICLCPPGFIGAQCQIAFSLTNGVPTSTIQGQLAINSIGGVPAVFTSDLNVPGSPARDALLGYLMPLLNQFIGPQRGVLAIVITSFSPGSIFVQYNVTMDSDSTTTSDNIDRAVTALVQYASSSGLIVDSAGTFTRDADSTVDQSRDQTALSGGEIGGILVGVFGIILLMMLIGLCICFALRRENPAENRFPGPAATPNINTLDLAPYPYTFPRPDANGINQNTMLF